MLKKLLIGLLAIVAIIASIAARQGTSFTVERAIDIRAPHGKIFALLADLHQWRQWSPSDNPAPHVRRAYSRVAITHVAVRQIDLTMEVAKPVASTSQASFTLAPTASGTHVTWRLHGPLTFRARLITAFIGIDMLLGSELEKGLAGLRAAAEK